MARRSRASDGSVRGPSSALTNFLASLGVEAQLAPPPDPNAAAGPSSAGDSSVQATIPEEEEPEELQSDEDVARPKKRRRAVSVDSDDLDGDDGDDDDDYTPANGNSAPKSNLTAGAAARRGPLKSVGEFMNCGECGEQFTVTAYTKEHPKRAQTWLCTSCCPKLGIDAFAKPKKGKATKPPPPKKVRAKIVHYEVAKGVTPLADTCIEIIGQYIEEVEALGDIGAVNLDKVCKIICKMRRLTAETANLFYDVDRQELDMYDCTNLVHTSYVALANLNPNLEKLNLQMCGQISTDTLVTWGKSLKNLKSLELNGPFLVRKAGWISFFKDRGKKLEGLSITQSPRIDLETIEALVKSCPNLKNLKLTEMGQLDSEFLEPLAKLTKLESLAIISPGSTPLSDEAVVTLLKAVGSHLTTLDLSENKELGDEILVAMAECCPKLQHLSLRNVHFSEAGVKKYFETLSSAEHPGFVTLDLEKGHDLAGSSLGALTKHSSRTLERLSIMGWKHVDADTVSGLSACSQLRFLDLGWCRNVTDFTLKDIIDGCNHINEIRVWGCNQLTDRVPRKRGLKVIGIETHAL